MPGGQKPMPKGRKGRTPDQILKDREEIARLYLQRLTQREIGERLGLSRQQVGYDTGLNPFRNQYRLGPFNWIMDSSVRKTFKFGESGHTQLRIAIDVFNIFNNQGLNTPGGNGIVTLQNSYNPYGFQPRQVQGGFRFEF